MKERTYLQVERSRRGWTQTYLAALIGRAQGQISLYETRKVIPDEGTLDKLADVLRWEGSPEGLLEVWTPQRKRESAPLTRVQ